jgi:hypothetical protein
MQFIKNTSRGKSNNILRQIIKFSLILIFIFICIILLNKVDFPAPIKEIEKTIPNEKIRIVK